MIAVEVQLLQACQDEKKSAAQACQDETKAAAKRSDIALKEVLVEAQGKCDAAAAAAKATTTQRFELKEQQLRAKVRAPDPERSDLPTELSTRPPP